MTAKAADQREALRLIAEAIAQDLMEAPLEEALKEIQEDSGRASRGGEALRRDVAALVTRVKKERLIAAKEAYRNEASRARSVRDGVRLARDVLVDKIAEVLARQPELEGKIGFAFRDRQKVTDRELETILEDLQELEQRAASQSSKR
jgi:hypothetical protein